MHQLMRNALLVLIALLLAANLYISLRRPQLAYAQSGHSSSLWIEPGVTMLRAPDGSRQVLGKTAIDLTNGNVWGLPTTVQQPYPVDVMKTDPPTSQPFLIGRFNLDRIYSRQ